MFQYIKLIILIFISSALAIITLALLSKKDKIFITEKLSNLTSSWSSSDTKDISNLIIHLSNGRKLEHFKATDTNVDHCVLYNFLRHQRKK